MARAPGRYYGQDWREKSRRDWEQRFQDISGDDYWGETLGRAGSNVRDMKNIYNVLEGFNKQAQTGAINTGFVGNYPQYFQYSPTTEYGWSEGGPIREWFEGAIRPSGQRIEMKPGLGYDEVFEGTGQDPRVKDWFWNNDSGKLQDLFKKKFGGGGVGGPSGLNMPQFLGIGQGLYRGLKSKKPSDMIHGALQAFGAAGAFGGAGIPILALNYLWDMFD